MEAAAAVFLPVVFTMGLMQAANAENGQAAYEKSCKACHGANGSGNPASKDTQSVNSVLGSLAAQGLSDDQDQKNHYRKVKGKCDQ